MTTARSAAAPIAAPIGTPIPALAAALFAALAAALAACAGLALGQPPPPVPPPVSPTKPASPVSPSALELIDTNLVSALTTALGRTLRDPTTRDATLLGLRRLRDPSLRPLLVALSIAPDPQLQLHGLLGLAELDPRRQIDLLSVRQLPTPSWRSAVVREGFAEGLIDDTLLAEVCAWPDLDASVLVTLAARMAARSQDNPARAAASLAPQRLAPLLDDPRPEVSALAAILLLQSQDPLEPATAAARTLKARLESPGGLPTESGTRIVRAAADAMLASAGPTLVGIAASAKARQQASGSAGLTVEAKLAQALWAEAIGAGIVIAANDSRAVARFADAWNAASADDRAELALAALDVARRLGPQTPVRLAGAMDNAGTLAVTTIADAVRALASDETLGERPQSPGAKDPAAKEVVTPPAGPAPTPAASPAPGAVRLSVPVAVVRVLALNDAALVPWAMRVADDRPAQDAREIRLRVLAMALAESRGSGPTAPRPLRGLGIEAAAELADQSPTEVLKLLELARVQGDADACELLMLGLIRRAGELAATAERSSLTRGLPLTSPDAWPSAAGAALALLLACQTGDAPLTDPAVRARLSALALDAEQQATLPPALRAMAAWLALRGLGADRVALARLLDA